MAASGAKSIKRLLFKRATPIFLAMLVQIVLLAVVAGVFLDSFYIFYLVGSLVSVVSVVWILNEDSNAAYKLAWIIPILVFPFFGGMSYLAFGRTRLDRRSRRRLGEIDAKLRAAMSDDGEVCFDLEQMHPDALRYVEYLRRHSSSPLYRNGGADFLPSGERAFESMLEAIGRARKYVFLEFFIISEGEMWDRMLALLERKASEGLDVRLLYDDFGCLSRLPANFPERLSAKGIQCAVFNPLRPVLSSRLNHRDHRKIVSVDGRVAFTGGVNIADEYINSVERFGRWKDSAIRVSGGAAWGLTLCFLSLWEYATGDARDYLVHKPDFSDKGAGFLQPYWDSPMDTEPVGESVYMDMAGSARKYLYITTPYLILDGEMQAALRLAAKGGVDVRIITPGIPDKRYVYHVTRANYRPLLDAGVRIFEYRPGFIHSKTFVSDDFHAVVGTINLDFRSLYLHFECGVRLYGSPCVAAVRDEFLATLADCEEITRERLSSFPLWGKLVGWILRVFSPLM